jgi:hypothetical protein
MTASNNNAERPVENEYQVLKNHFDPKQQICQVTKAS